MTNNPRLLNPVGNVRPASHSAAPRAARTGKPVIGLLDNSKPNVALFVQSIEDELRRMGHGEIVKLTKPRSAAPSPDLEALAARCDFVVNALAD